MEKKPDFPSLGYQLFANAKKHDTDKLESRIESFLISLELSS